MLNKADDIMFEASSEASNFFRKKKKKCLTIGGGSANILKRLEAGRVKRKQSTKKVEKT